MRGKLLVIGITFCVLSAILWIGCSVIVEEKDASNRFTAVRNPLVQTSGILFVRVEINLKPNSLQST